MSRKQSDVPGKSIKRRAIKRSRLAGSSGRSRILEDKLLAIKLAPANERVRLVGELAKNENLTLAERRQILLALQRYVLNQRAELQENVTVVLDTIIALANRRELRSKALELFQSVLDALARKDVAKQIVEPLERLLKQFVPKGSKLDFSPDLFVKAGNRLEQAQDYTGIISLANLGLFFFPFHGALRELRADFCYILGHIESSKGDLDHLIEQFPERFEYLLDRAEVLIQLEDFESALNDLDSYLRQSPNDPAALKRKVDCLGQIGRNMEAIRICNMLIDLEGERPEYFIWRARSNDQLDFMEEAATDVKHALELDPESQEAKQLQHSLQLRRQSYGIEDDLYSAFNRGEESLFLGEPSIPQTRFTDIGGLESVKRMIKETILYPLQFKEISAHYGKKAGGGMLLFGPPGCGKTLLARASAGECGVYYINVNLSTVLDKWVGNSEKAVSMIFQAARKHSPSIIFLDEVDAIGGSRANLQAGWEKKLISQLLIELDGLTSDNRDVMVLAASNAPWEVDFALRRPGRIGKLVFVPAPGPQERSEIFKIYLEKKPDVEQGIDYALLGSKSELHSADSIHHIVEAAASIPWRNAIETGEVRAITQDDVLTALSQAKPDLAEWEKLVARYREFADQSLKRPSIGFRRGPVEQS